MFIQKINMKLVWGINLILFICVVFLGIEQAAKGADISKLESQLETISTQKTELTENIFKSGNDVKLTDNAINLGFAKPLTVYYFNSEEVSLTLK